MRKDTTPDQFGLTSSEYKTLSKLKTPIQIQDFLDRLPINFEKKGETYMSPRRVLTEWKAHCIEGALLAATALWLHGESPLLLDLTAKKHDTDHVIALYKRNGFWGAVSKSNHAVLGFRDPIFKTIRELALSYFNEYYLAGTGEKTLLSYSSPVDLRKLGIEWITAPHDLFEVEKLLNQTTHHPFVPNANKRLLRPASRFELKVLNTAEWQKRDPRT